MDGVIEMVDVNRDGQGPGELSDITVNGVTIPREALIEQIRLQSGAGGPEEALANAARTLVVQALLLQEASGLTVQPRADESCDEARIRLLLERQIKVEKPTEKDCREFFSKNPEKLGRKELLEVSHILIGADTKVPGARQQAKGEAQLIMDAVQVAPQRFAELARKHSDCPSREVGGNLGQIGRGQMVPEFERQVFALEEGLALELIDTRFGFHVVRVDRKIPGPPVDFDYARNMIVDYLAERQNRIAVRQYIDGLLSTAHVQGVSTELLRKK